MEHAQHRGLEDAQLYELLGFLNMIGALERSRSIRDWVRMGSHGLWFLGFVSRFAALGYRRPANLKNIVLLTCKACTPVIAAVLVVGAAYYLLGISSMVTVVLFGLLSLAIFIGSVTVHEVGHAVILWRAGITCSVMRSGMRIGLLHRGVERALERKAALAGPLTASLPLFIIAVIAFAYVPLIAVACAAIGTFHLASLLPWYGDGISIWKSEDIHGRS
jgi:hypothetical protein